MAPKKAPKKATKAPKATKRQREEPVEAPVEATEAPVETPVAAPKVEKDTYLPLWPVLQTPTPAVFAAKPSAKAALLTTNPVVLAKAWARTEVAAPTDDVDAAILPSALFAIKAAADIAASSAPYPAGEKGAAAAAAAVQFPVVIVCGSTGSLHATAWAARCNSVLVAIVNAVGDEDTRRTPVELVGEALGASKQATAVLIPSSMLVAAGKKAGTDPAAWLSGRTLVTLPDVENAEDLQPMDGRAFFVLPPAQAAGAPRVRADLVPAPAATEAAEPPAKASKKEDSSAAAAATARYVFSSLPMLRRSDSCLSTTLVARGDIPQALKVTERLFGFSAARCEEALFNALLGDWGLDGDALLMHHKLAMLLRALIDVSIAHSGDKHRDDANSLAHLAARVITRLVRHLPPLTPEQGKAALFLRATLCYCFPQIPLVMTDALAAAWGTTALGVVGGSVVLKPHGRMRSDATHALHMRYLPRLGRPGTEFLEVLHHFIAEAVHKEAVTVRALEAQLCWSKVLLAEVGSIGSFLAACQLLHSAEAVAAATTRSAVSRSKKLAAKAGSATSGFTAESLVRPLPNTKFLKMPTLELPVAEAKLRKRNLMERMALDETLSAMPSSRNVPMYVGDIGALIGKWTSFNARYGGKLGHSLIHFLEAHPEEFRIVSNVVTRVNDSKGDQVKVRFDEDNTGGHDSDDEDGGKKKKKPEIKAVTRGGKPMSTIRRSLLEAEAAVKSKGLNKKTQKKKLKQLRNKARYDRNHKSVSSDAKVKGYTKPSERKLSGRGKKANIRKFKR